MSQTPQRPRRPTRAAAATDEPSAAGVAAPGRHPPAALQLVHDVARRHFGERAKRVVARGGGLTNAVHEFTVSQGRYIVRSHADATKINDYLKEQWAMDAARAAGLPTPDVLEVGNQSNGRAYMILQCVAGIDGRLAPARLQLLETLGRAAATLHGIRTHGFGPVFDWSSNQLSRHASWAGWLADGFDVRRRLAVLRQHRMLDEAGLRQLECSADAMANWRKRPMLQHGDLRLKNVLVDADTGRLAAIIDWENCVSLPAPHWELSLALHDLGVDEKEAFLSGYGIKPAAVDAAMPFIRMFNLLNYVHAIESAVRKKDRARIDRFRLRFKGGLDLFRV